ncbi:DNA cytosine methyltransferase [Desulforamulus ferrireducens]|uniref:Cytosine-specific methyltransferase n=1 Tax=Desulforamulus ferrireducens TaxID=1833852 RepID=A0A1S6IXM6_9FIRM|nr:DNA cytosine methyltransferase [Desulforamulus ferrireducens]AQS59523.1 hypothetical protein B0537_10790 [Desulforamulus ferrireducens]
MTYKIISLFSGAGFLDFGFAENGFEIVWGAELISEFALANNYNMRLRYGHSNRVHNIDITMVNPRDIPIADGVIGGPPCQDFSKGNAKSQGVEGNRGSLVWDFLAKIEYLRPKFFLFENVDALYTTKKHRTEALMPLLEQFSNLGYKPYFRVLNALDYGIPQDRSRVFIVAFREEIINLLQENDLPIFQWPKPLFNNAKDTFKWPDMWDYGTVVDEEDFINQLQYPYCLTVHSRIGREEELINLPNHISFRAYSNKFFTTPEGKFKGKSFKRLHRFRYSPTLAYGNNEVHLHPTKPRRLTVREALRIQSVPDWYEFPVGLSLTDMFKMVGNGVAFELAELLAIQIKEVLDNYYSIINEPFAIL